MLILSTCIAALLVACGALFGVQVYFSKRNFVQDMASTAKMVAAQSMAAVDFENTKAAENIIVSLSEKAGVVGAKLFIVDGSKPASLERQREFAAFGSVGDSLDGIIAGPHKKQSWAKDQLLLEFPLIRDNEQIGALFVKCDYGQQSGQLLNLHIGIFCMVLAVSVLVAWVISARLGRIISAPIQQLADTAKAIADSDNYHIRAEKLGNDELGSFTQAFNYMLDQVEFRDAALRKEIEVRQAAEAKLQETQNQLIEASHQAGMAEVATGVLHNVGNVLNSVNVSASVISEKLNGDRLDKLQRAAALLLEKNGSLANFLSEDPKGKLLPTYLSNLGTHLVSERKDALSELESLARNIEHIKEIVAMQQSHARVFGLIERIQPESLVDDAIRMVSMSLRRHQIELIKTVENSKPVDVDRHKILQILVNLLRNAKHAMENSENDLRRITVSVIGDEAGSVRITVTDTGCGIPKENLTKIFSHGFTTRRDGHGFGLHSSALAAHQMGGSLFVNSEGAGHGASFTLELPPVNQDIATV